jgi:hypothetical protein
MSFYIELNLSWITASKTGCASGPSVAAICQDMAAISDLHDFPDFRSNPGAIFTGELVAG